ncbi:hypothetical protein [Profundibacter sp.]
MTLINDLRQASERLDLLDDDVIDTLDENQLGGLSTLCQRAAEALAAGKQDGTQ